MGKIRFEIDGLNLDRLINKLEDNNIGIENVEKSDYNKMVLTCKSKNFGKVKEILKALHLEYTIIGGSGLLYFFKKNWFRFGLLIGLIFTIYACFYVTSIYWNVEVVVDTENAQIQEKVVEYLNSQNLKVGAKKQKITTRDIERKILKNINECSLVVVEENGVNIKVFVRQSVERSGVAESDVVASRSGVIEKIDIKSGNLLVNVGEAVVSGQPLIKADKVGDVFLEAKGDIFARCWIAGESVGSVENKAIKRTGRVITVEYITMFGQKLYSSKNTGIDAENTFLKYQTEVTESNLSQNNLLPIKKISINYYEIEEVCDIISHEQLVENLKQQALTNAERLLPQNAENLGVTYKVIEMGSITKVVCNIETVINIAKRGE